jgi:TonB-linked SusC/RagA family outer membrane protein
LVPLHYTADAVAANLKDPVGYPSGSNVTERTVGGKVTSGDGEGLPGVSVTIKNTTRGTITNAKGEFTLEVADNDAILVFSFVGYESQELQVGGKSDIAVVLQESEAALSEVVVIGYGTVKKSDVTGSVVSIKSDDLKAVPVTSFDQALQGRAAGVQVVQSTGAPGGETNIRIRGTSSVNASSEPLYVIDGMLINGDGGEMSVGGRGPRIGALSTINPGDIESIEILKDASATAIYGSRGANGVVLITTKKGKANSGSINFESYYGTQQAANKLKLLRADQFANLVNEANINSGRVPVYSNPSTLGAGTDWQNELLRSAPMANYQLSVNGGSTKTKYAISGGYFTQDGIVIGSNFRRYSLRTNVETEVNKYLSVGANFSYNRLSSDGVLTGPGQIVPGVITGAMQFNPIATVYDPRQMLGYTYEHFLKTGVANPVAEAREYKSNTGTNRFLGNVFAQLKLAKDLSFRSSFGIDALNSKSNAFGPFGLKRTENSLGEASSGALQAFTWLSTNTVNYDKNIGSGTLSALVGFEAQQFKNESMQLLVFDFPDPRSGYHNLGAGQNPQPPANGETEWSLMSYLGRINYSLSNKYLITVSGRVDGSSKFAKGNKYGFFPSAALAWRVSEEDFLQGNNVISNLKLRGSYGVTGNQSIAPYGSLALITPFGEGVFNNGSGSPALIYGREPLSYPNENLKWETTRQANIGIDLSVLRGRVSLTTELYHKKTSDLLLSTPIPLTSGFQSTLLNVGNVENKGLDVELSTINFDGDFSWNTSLNVSLNRNKITNLAGGGDVLLAGGNILREGQPLGSFFGYVFDGIYQSDEEARNSPAIAGQSPSAGDRKYRDVSGADGKPDGVINDMDRTLIGSAQPKFYWGLNNTLSYKNFELNFFFQGSQGNKMVNMNLLNLQNVNGQQNVLLDAYEGRWTPTNPSTKYARPLATANDNIFSSRFVENASYLRLRNISLGYNLPKSVLEKIRVNRLKVYVSAANLLTLTNYSGYNPEGNAYGSSTNVVGVDDGNYPQTKTFLVGINIGL